MDLGTLLEQASQSVARGNSRGAAESYEAALAMIRGPQSPLPPAERPQLVRSVAFNLAQVLNKVGEFQKALSQAEIGLQLRPTEVGRAIGLAAKGEALGGLGRAEEARAAFLAAAQAHPVIGRLNAADSMTRLAAPHWLALAEEWVNAADAAFGSQLPANLREEVATIRAAIAARRKAV